MTALPHGYDTETVSRTRTAVRALRAAHLGELSEAERDETIIAALDGNRGVFRLLDEQSGRFGAWDRDKDPAEEWFCYLRQLRNYRGSKLFKSFTR